MSGNRKDEIDLINISSGNRPERKRYREDYLEDWDSREYRPVRKEKAAGKSKEILKEKSGVKSKERIKGKSGEGVKDKSKKKRRKKSRFKKFVAILVVFAGLLALSFCCIIGFAYGKMNYGEIPAVSGESLADGNVINVLLIGNDSRKNGEDGRSDAMIILSINKTTKKIYMTSLLRDMYVEIPGYKGNRLNAAYSYGGAELLMETIEQNFDIELNRYVLVNFEAFAHLVDAVEGIDLELTNEEVLYVNGYLVEYNILLDRPQGTDELDPTLSGMVHLNGAQALAYSRNRFLGTDFGRTERQRKVLSAVIRKIPIAIVKNPKELMDGLLPNLTTNLTKSECYRLGFMAGKVLTYDIEQISIPQPGTYRDATIREMAVLEVDFEANKQYIRETIYKE